MHVVFIDSIPNPGVPGQGGLSDITWRLGLELAEAGIHVDIVGPYDTDVDVPYIHENLVTHVVPDARIARRNVVTHVLCTYRLARAANKLVRRNTIVQVNDSVAAACACLLGLGTRVVWHGHSNVYHHSAEENPWDRITLFLLKSATRYAARRGATVIALGDGLRRWWNRSGFSDDNIFTIPNAIDLPTNSSLSESWRLSEQWRDYQFHVAYVGRLSREKGGYEELIGAIAQLNQQGMPVLLTIVGDGPERATILHLVSLLKYSSSVELLGQAPRETVDWIMSQVDLVVLPSKGEMMPRVMLEAWAVGAPFMATPVGAIPDYLIDGYNGYLVEELTADCLAVRMRDALLNAGQRKLVGERGKDTAARLNWRCVADLFIEVYERVLSRQ